MPPKGMTPFATGQRWVSETEPELGLGTVLKSDNRTVDILFQAHGTIRQYACGNAPLRRVRFGAGDTIKHQDGRSMKVSAVTGETGCLVYVCEQDRFHESELNDELSLRGPQDRVLNGHFDELETFDLRLETLEHQHWRRQSEARGFVGGRMDLIPHQIYIAHEITSRHAPRVLLADEVGLGKTIESCLIVHRLLASGRAERVLILVPEPLIHQWFVELLRRFNLWFHIYDEERCDAIESAEDPENPFQSDQWVLCGIGLLAQNPRRAEQALAAGWDLLVVDEAHHLSWNEQVPSPEYALVEALGRVVPGLILLSATPEQFGLQSHFARLRLLDPDRFHSFEAFCRESGDYKPVAEIAARLLQGESVTEEDTDRVASLFPAETQSLRERMKAANTDPAEREALINDLIDRHGTGRVMFRNTRATMTGFPTRIPRLVALNTPEPDPQLLERLAREHIQDTQHRGAGPADPEPDFSNDPRVIWLADLIRRLQGEKVLLICRTRSKVEAIDQALRAQLNVNTAQFHEELALVQRDRNAAWFADPDGATLLLSSEIGSEGRNFQFAHHLVLFDLPSDPELLEQRIGRLDRIGQDRDIQIHIPYVPGSAQSVLVHWYHQGLHAFEQNLHGGRELLEQFGKRIADLSLDFHETADQEGLDALIQETTTARQELLHQLEAGRDRLLELNSYRAAIGEPLIRKIAELDRDTRLETYMTRVFDHHGIHVEELGGRTYRLGSNGVFADLFPGLPQEGLTVTCDRQAALAREDIAFLSWDHPVVTGAMDLILGNETGNSAYAWWPDPQSRSLLLEAVYVLECVAPAWLHAERFLPPTPIRLVVDRNAADLTLDHPTSVLSKSLRAAPIPAILDTVEVKHRLLPALFETTRALAEERGATLIREATHHLENCLGPEIERLKALSLVNPNVRANEIELATRQFELLRHHLGTARLRPDALRVVWKGPQL